MAHIAALALTTSVVTGPSLASAAPSGEEVGGHVVAWGGGPGAKVPPGLDDVIAVAAGQGASLALRGDGTVVGWGRSPISDVPPDLRDVTAISAGDTHALALRKDGTVVAWGRDDMEQTDVPADLGEVTAIAAGANHNLALRKDGTVVAWGMDDLGQTDVPVVLRQRGHPAVAIAAGRRHSLAVFPDGNITSWGGPSYATAVPRQPINPHDRFDDLVVIAADLPARLGLTPVKALAASGGNSLALREDGTVLQWGSSSPVAPGAIGVVGIAAGNSHSLALRADGTVVGWGGNNWFGQTTPPLGLTGVTAIAAGGDDTSAGAQSLAVTTSPLPTVPLPRLPFS